MYRFFTDQTNIDTDQGVIRITGEDVNHIRNALRMKPGEEILVCTGRRDDPVEYLCEISETEPDEIRARILDFQRSARELPADIYLFQAIPKGDRFETVIEKSVELGARGIVPVVTARTIVRLDDKRALKKTERWNALAYASAKQSKRSVVPGVEPPVSWKGALELAARLDRIIVPYENSAHGMKHTREVLSSVEGGSSVGIFIGPEGGFEEKEVSQLENMGADEVTLGHRILRTDTAGLFVLSALALFLED